MKPTIVGKITSIEPDSSYEGITHTQLVGIQCGDNVMLALDAQLLVGTTFIGKTCEVSLECFLGKVTLQGDQVRKGIDVTDEHHATTLYGAVVDIGVESSADPQNPCKEITLLLDVGEGTLQCFLIDSPIVGSDFYRVPELEIGSYIVLLASRIDLKEITLYCSG